MPKYDQFDLDVRNLKVNVLYVDEETSINACDSSGSVAHQLLSLGFLVLV